jgi:hypothetical protein
MLGQIDVFKSTAGHELIHAIHIYNGLSIGALPFHNTEYVAHNYSANIFLGSGNMPAYLEYLQNIYRLGYFGIAPKIYYDVLPPFLR